MSTSAFIPEGYNTLVPAILMQDAAAAIEWYKEIFGAVERLVLKYPSGRVAHAELQFGDSLIMMGEEDAGNKSQQLPSGNSISLCLYVQNVDAVIEKAIDKGATVVAPATDQFYGDRTGRIKDPFGYVWILSTHVKDVSPQEMQSLMNEMMSTAQ